MPLDTCLLMGDTCLLMGDPVQIKPWTPARFTGPFLDTFGHRVILARYCILLRHRRAVKRFVNSKQGAP